MKKTLRSFIALLFSLSIAMTSVISAAAANVATVTNLKAAVNSLTAVTLSWTKLSGVTGYEVEQLSGKNWKAIKTGLTDNSFKVTGLKTGSTYKFRVRAYKTTKSFFLGERTEKGEYSQTVSVKLIPQKVSATVSSVTTTSAKLTWKKISGVTGYFVQRKDGKKWKTVATLKAKTKSYAITKLTLGKTYSYRVVAYKKVGKKNILGTPSKTLKIKPAVAKPTAVKVSSLNATSATISWKKVSEANGYRVQIKNGNAWKTVKTINKNSTVSYKASIVPSATYEYRVSAYKKIKKKTYYSAAVNVKVSYKVGSASALKASANATSVKLNWTGANGVSGYEVQMKNGNAWKTVAKVNTNSATVSTEPSKSYTFRVVSFVTVSGKNYYGAASNTVNAKYTVKGASSLNATATQNAANLSWTGASGVSGYEVQLQNGNNWQTVAKVNTTSATVAIEPSVSYNFRVVSFVTVNGKNYYGAASNTKSVRYDVNGASSLNATATQNAANLSWTGANGVSGYEVQLQNGNNWQTVAIVQTTSATVAIEPSVSYNFRVVSFVTANGKNYYGAASNTKSVRYDVNGASSLKVNSTAPASANLSWNAAAGVSGYEVQMKNGNSWQTVAKVNATSATVAIEPARDFSFRVVSFVTANGKNYYGAASNTVSVKYNVSAPTALKATKINDTSATLSWTGAKNASGYMVYCGNNLVATTAQTSVTVSSLAKSTSYSFTVKAYVSVNSKNYLSSNSNTVTIKTAPDKTGGLSYSNLAEKSLTLNWSKVNGAEGYTVYKYNPSTKVFDSLKTVSSNSLSVTGLVGDTTYQFKVAAYHKANGSVLYGAQSDALSVTTYFDSIENLVIKDLKSNYSVANIDWSKIDDVTYEAYMCNTVNPQWVRVNENKGHNEDRRDYYYLTVDAYDFGFKLEETQSFMFTASWNSVKGASKYEVQTRTNGARGTWTKQAETTSTSVTFPVAPATEYEVRVIVYNASFKVCAVKGERKTAFAQIDNIPGLMSSVISKKSANLPALDPNNKNIKTAYVLKALQAVNNTKAELSIKNYTKRDLVTSKIEDLSVKKGSLPILLPDSIFEEDLTKDLNEDNTYKGTVESGRFKYTLNGAAENRVTTFSDTITPYDGDAYLYNAADINSINSKVTAISYTKNADSTETITFKLAKEKATRALDKTPLHNGIIQSYEGMASADGIDDGWVEVGESTVTVVINQNGTLNSMSTVSPFRMYTKASAEGFTIDVTIKGTSTSTYSFAR